MQRRNFIKSTSLFALGVSVAGNVRWNFDRYEGTTPTTTDILGPFYRPGAPMRSNLVPAGTPGERIHLSGIIFKDDGKTPYKDCVIEIWQCSPEGIYDNTSDDYNYRGAQKTGVNGKYHFSTSIPVPYSVNDEKTIYRPAHIHMRVSGSQEQDLVTQIYLSGDPYLQKDLYSKSPQAVNRILAIKKNNKNENSLRFDIVMTKEFPLEDAVLDKIAGIYNMNDKTMVEFYKYNDLLFAKINGQIAEALYYKGNNLFTSALDVVKVRFDLKEKGDAKVSIDYLDDITNKWTKSEGTRMFKYKS